MQENQSIVMWLICKNRLLTKCRFGEIRRGLSSWIGYDLAGDSVKVRKASLKNIKPMKKRQVTRAIYAATCYGIWKARNAKIHK
ncbi:hypothetical protein DM860_011349 [Cuscuta australis]|uniref:Uncharacterized protein n=1 Tax=Cuscuta australis TaxID=267555 RepID=A0A328DU27_9ASTE|nr:hypothetical protein DM860_011349 [Cuscuta australis]